MEWVNRKGAASKPPIAPGLIKEIGFTFYEESAEIVQTDNIPPICSLSSTSTRHPCSLF